MESAGTSPGTTQAGGSVAGSQSPNGGKGAVLGQGGSPEHSTGRGPAQDAGAGVEAAGRGEVPSPAASAVVERISFPHVDHATQWRELRRLRLDKKWLDEGLKRWKQLLGENGSPSEKKTVTTNIEKELETAHELIQKLDSQLGRTTASGQDATLRPAWDTALQELKKTNDRIASGLIFDGKWGWKNEWEKDVDAQLIKALRSDVVTRKSEVKGKVGAAQRKFECFETTVKVQKESLVRKIEREQKDAIEAAERNRAASKLGKLDTDTESKDARTLLQKDGRQIPETFLEQTTSERNRATQMEQCLQRWKTLVDTTALSKSAIAIEIKLSSAETEWNVLLQGYEKREPDPKTQGKKMEETEKTAKDDWEKALTTFEEKIKNLIWYQFWGSGPIKWFDYLVGQL